ncbi:hypothetical protein FPSE_09608 [Fusarium pseudograminearum CS3096]|uniref:Uncharacterized protein n=1 Tax=Fusarium pseudograminearum (strain CS3096) TaxID=1028729 RepID=K3V9X3_FUSPC|nr:hypothetical protein FPSE_09608 [Fusarium pseudograminearum CS3096]EKJ70234.1 hypothetical protein FPSE_09608 [Fusarium pseudograminearum CS3096]
MSNVSSTMEIEATKEANGENTGGDESDVSIWSGGDENREEVARIERDSAKNGASFQPIARDRRIPEGDIFENIFGIEDSETDGEQPPPVISQFLRSNLNYIDFDHGFERGDLKYAPSRRNPYYMAIQGNKFNELFGRMENSKEWATTTSRAGRTGAMSAIGSYFNVSLKLFHDMANDCVDWLSLSRLVDPQVAERIADDEENEAAMLKEMAFDGLLDAPKNDPLQDEDHDAIQHHPVVFPIEPMWKMSEEDTNPPVVHAVDANVVDIDAMWAKRQKDIGREIFNDGRRRIYIPIRHPMGWLMWVRLEDWGTTEEARLAQLGKIKDGFLDIWMTATATDPESAAGYRARFTSVDLGFPLFVVPHPKKLHLQLGKPLGEVNTFFENLVYDINMDHAHPFTELIVKAQDEVNGDGWVKMGENPFGLFDTYIHVDHYDAYMKTLEILNAFPDEILARKDAHRVSKTSPRDIRKLENWLTANVLPMPEKNHENKDNYTEAQKDARSAMDKWKLIARISPLKQLYFKDDDFTFESAWCIDVSSKKITDASGKRIHKYQPAKIIGMHANDFADYALGWDPLDRAEELLKYKHRMSSGFFMAEWLHLCAFSWGGLTKIPQDGQLLYRSSDIPGNLVLGTSETNSVMTRHVALPTKDSPDLNSPSSYPKLTVTRNIRNKHVVRDVKDEITGRYSRTTSEMSIEEKGIATKYHFLAYTISYSISFPQGSKLLNMKAGTSLNTMFYPFLRPVYHKLEDELDQALYGEIKNRDENNVGQREGLFPSRATSLGPYNQDGSDIYAGNAPYGDLMGLQQNAASAPEVQFQTATRYGVNAHNHGDGTNHEEKEKIKKRFKK